MEEKRNKTRLAAVGDIHVRESDRGKWTDYFKTVSSQADVLLLCGDLTDTGLAKEAQVLAEELKACSIPVVAVLGNHDYHHDQQGQIKKILEQQNVCVLDGGSTVIGNVGFAGIKGFGGGFDERMLSMFGESMMKRFVQEAVDDALRLDSALMRLGTEHEGLKKVVVLHYSPIKATVAGEPEQIFPFLGSSRLVEPINSRDVIVAFHGHAHMGTLEGVTNQGVKVYNVSKHVLERAGYEVPFFPFEVEVDSPVVLGEARRQAE